MNDEVKNDWLRPGTIVGERYRLEQQIGEGGMGRVYLAEDLRLKGQRWAVKWVPRHEHDPEQPEKEAAMMTALQHPSLPRIVDYVRERHADGCYLVMDFIKGETLLERSAAFHHRMPWRTVIQYALQLCDLLDYLHTLDSPIVFRDMKPSNVIVGADERVRLIDFGIARTYKAGKAADTVHVGSVGFAAPELLAGKQTDHRADIYSLGCLVYFIMSGGQYYNFSKGSVEQRIEEIPSVFAETLHKMLEDDPLHRFPNAKAAKEALQSIVDRREFHQAGAQPSQVIAPRRTVIAVAGLFPHAGATFIAVTLAKLLSECNVRVTYAECPWQRYDPFLRMQAVSKGSLPAWQEGALSWRLQAGEDEDSGVPFDPAALYKMLFEIKSDVVIFDISSSADPAAVESLFHASDLIVAVAAPDPAGLRSAAAVANWARVIAASDKERIAWVANRMPESLRLSEFYKLFSQKPCGAVPEIDYDRMMESKWKGVWIADEPDIRSRLKDALQPLLRKAAPSLPENRGIRAATKRWLANKWPIDYNKLK
jgi:serine/threonine protein kinase